MKNLMVLVVLIAASYAQTGDMMQDPQMKEWSEQCAKETGAVLSNFSTGPHFRITAEFMQKREYKCFTKCFLMKTGYMNEKGEINMDKLAATAKNVRMDPAGLTEAATKCSAENKQDDLCDRATAITTCMFTTFGLS